jgi:tetrahydromethanopterin S-methyltransferase subunit F
MLMQQIRTSENQRNIAYCDSMLQVTNAAIEKAMLAFSLQKDPQYQEIGNYIPKLTPSTQLFTRNTLRSGVSEDGKIYLESIVVGQNIGHRQVRASLSDGSYAETLPELPTA